MPALWRRPWRTHRPTCTAPPWPWRQLQPHQVGSSPCLSCRWLRRAAGGAVPATRRPPQRQRAAAAAARGRMGSRATRRPGPSCSAARAHTAPAGRWSGWATRSTAASSGPSRQAESPQVRRLPVRRACGIHGAVAPPAAPNTVLLTSCAALCPCCPPGLAGGAAQAPMGGRGTQQSGHGTAAQPDYSSITYLLQVCSSHDSSPAQPSLPRMPSATQLMCPLGLHCLFRRARLPQACKLAALPCIRRRRSASASARTSVSAPNCLRRSLCWTAVPASCRSACCSRW